MSAKMTPELKTNIDKLFKALRTEGVTTARNTAYGAASPEGERVVYYLRRDVGAHEVSLAFGVKGYDAGAMAAVGKTIAAICERERIPYKWGGDYGSAFIVYAGVADADTSVAEVGAKILVTRLHNNTGRTGTITSIDGARYGVVIDGESFGKTLLYRSQFVVIATATDANMPAASESAPAVMDAPAETERVEAPAETARAFVVGDRVRVVDGKFSRKHVGSEGVIVEIWDDHTQPYIVEIGKIRQGFYASELELVTPAQSADVDRATADGKSAPAVTLTEEQAALLSMVETGNKEGEGVNCLMPDEIQKLVGLIYKRNSTVRKYRGYWLTDAGRAALAAYEATADESAPAWTPKVGERVRVKARDFEGEVTAIWNGTMLPYRVRGAVGLGDWFDADELAPVDAPAERADAADGETPIAEFEASVNDIDVAESIFVKMVLHIDDPAHSTLVDLERTNKRVRVVVYLLPEEDAR